CRVAVTVFNASRLRPLATRDPYALHQIAWHTRDGGGQAFSWRDYEELSRRTDLFSALPALQVSRLAATGALRGQGSVSHRGSRLRNVLVVGQVAVAIVLVVTAMTLARNGVAVGALDLGYDTRGVMSGNVRGVQDELARPRPGARGADPRVDTVVVTSGNPLFNQGRMPGGGARGRNVREAHAVHV